MSPDLTVTDSHQLHSIIITFVQISTNTTPSISDSDFKKMFSFVISAIGISLLCIIGIPAIIFYFFHYSPDAILVREDSPYQTLEDLVEAARQAPGVVTFSGSGTYSANDVANTRFQQLADVTTTYIPFKGTGAAVTALLGGQVQAEWGYTTVAANHQDKVRMLAVAAEERHPLFPDVPTFQELGYDMVGGAYRGMAVPSETPADVQARLSEIFDQINQNPQFRQEMEDLGFVLMDVGNDDVADFLAEQSQQYETSARELGLID